VLEVEYTDEGHYNGSTMSERRNTLACCFDPTSPRLTAFDIHEWIHSQLQVSEHSVLTIQIDGTRRQVFIKFTDFHFVQDILNATNGETVYKHTTGEISPVKLMVAGMGPRRIRLANLPPELNNTTIRMALSHYGDVQSIQDETWAKHYRYIVSNGVRIVMMTLKKHIPSHIVIDGNRALTSYDGQPQTCYGCGDTEHMYHVCPKRRAAKTTALAPVDHTWANIVAATITSVDVPSPSNGANMDTDTGAQAVEEIRSSDTSNGRSKLAPVPLEGRQPICDTLPSHTTAAPNQTSGIPTPLKWADEEPELHQTPSVWARTAEDVPVAAKEWPPLSQPAPVFTDSQNSQTCHTLSVVDTDENQAQTHSSTDSCTEQASDDFMLTGTTRKKKLRVDKTNGKSQNRKRNRTRTPATSKEKH